MGTEIFTWQASQAKVRNWDLGRPCIISGDQKLSGELLYWMCSSHIRWHILMVTYNNLNPLQVIL